MSATLTTLISFNVDDGLAANGASPRTRLVADASGDLIGIDERSDFYTAFEIAKSAAGYASTPMTISCRNCRS